jgi:hypothetical protein
VRETAGLEFARISFWGGKDRTKYMKSQALFGVIALSRNKQL